MSARWQWHLEECKPEDHDDWQRLTFSDALRLYGEEIRPCPDVAYMEHELFPDETVWVECVS